MPNLTAPPPLCSSDDFFDLTSLQDPAFPNGVWSGEGVNGTTFNPLVGTQNLTFTPIADCSLASSVRIIVNTATTPNLSPLEALCDSDSPINLPTRQDGVLGNWSGPGVSNNQFDPSNWGGNNITLVFSPNAGCFHFATTSIDVYFSSTPNLQSTTVCETDGLIDLTSLQDPAFPNGFWTGSGVSNASFDPSVGSRTISFTSTDDCVNPAMTMITVTPAQTPNLQSTIACELDGLIDLTSLQDASFPSGNWSGIGVDGTSFDSSVGTQVLTFTPSAPCTNPAMTTITIEAAQTPNLQSTTACELDGLIDLTSLQDASFPSGNWSGIGVDGTSFDSSVGTQVLTFMSSAPCTNPSMTTITIDAAQTPNLQSTTVCELDGLIDLTSLQDALFPSGNWSGIGVDGTSFDSSVGTQVLTFTPSAPCTNPSMTTITIEAAQTPNLQSTILCETDSLFNLETLQDPNFNNGIWSGVGVSNNMFVPSGLNGLMTLSFLSNEACVKTATTTVNVLSIPTVEMSGSTTICEGDEASIIFTLNGGGTFDVVYQNDSGQTFSLIGISDGHIETVSPTISTSYTLLSAIDNSNSLCSTILVGSVMVEVMTTLTVSNLIDDCDSSNISYSISFDISGGDVNSYFVSGLSGTLVGNTFVSDPISSGIPYSLVVDDANSCNPISLDGLIQCECPTITAMATISSDYNGYAISCEGLADGEAIINTPVGGVRPYTYAWSNGQTTEIATDLAAGMYQVTVTDNIGCTTEAIVELNAPEVLISEILSEDESCFGTNNGRIIFEGTTGGIAPFLYSIDSDMTQSTPIFDNLTIGTYTAFLEDANGCQFTEKVIIEQGEELMLDIGADRTIHLGDSLILNPIYPIGTTVDSFLWETTEFLDCNNYENPVAKPNQTITYNLTIIDENACEATDVVTIAVDRRRRIYIPNAFSPNDDGINDRFTIFSDEQVASIHSLVVLDRWGRIVHEAFNFQPNNELTGWDGKRKNKELKPSVFAYVTEIEFVDGNVEVFKGNVSLLR